MLFIQLEPQGYWDVSMELLIYHKAKGLGLGFRI